MRRMPAEPGKKSMNRKKIISRLLKRKNRKKREKRKENEKSAKGKF